MILIVGRSKVIKLLQFREIISLSQMRQSEGRSQNIIRKDCEKFAKRPRLVPRGFGL